MAYSEALVWQLPGELRWVVQVYNVTVTMNIFSKKRNWFHRTMQLAVTDVDLFEIGILQKEDMSQRLVFEVLIVVVMKSCIFCVVRWKSTNVSEEHVTSSSDSKNNESKNHLEAGMLPASCLVFCLTYSLTLKMEAIFFSKFVNFRIMNSLLKIFTKFMLYILYAENIYL
jgi:hypothetical protein